MSAAMVSSPCSESESPIRAVFCLKKKTDMKKFEEIDDCFILEFDPFETLNISQFSPSKNPHLSDDLDLSVLAQKGQVACRDYPHPRHLCGEYPFDKTSHETHCHMCFCFVCDTLAPCKDWMEGMMKHCDASENGNKMWSLLRDLNINKKLKSKPN